MLTLKNGHYEHYFLLRFDPKYLFQRSSSQRISEAGEVRESSGFYLV